ncbi:MAG: hypothetical protein ABEL76_15690 [Bradymonadaceae bacterium]
MTPYDMPARCPDCDALVPDEDLDEEENLGSCYGCGSVFQLSDDVRRPTPDSASSNVDISERAIPSLPSC